MPPDEHVELLHCPECRYNLHGLPTNRCPECGGEFDLKELREARDEPAIRVVLGTGFLIFVSCIFAALPARLAAGAFLIFDVYAKPGLALIVVYCILLSLGLAAGGMLGGAIGLDAWRELRRAPRIRGRGGVPMVAGMFLLVVRLLSMVMVYLPIAAGFL